MSLRNSQIFSWNGNVENRYIDIRTHNRNKMKNKYTFFVPHVRVPKATRKHHRKRQNRERTTKKKKYSDIS